VDGFEEEAGDNEGIGVCGVVPEVDASLIRSLLFRALKDDGIELDGITLTLVGGGGVLTQQDATMRS